MFVYTDFGIDLVEKLDGIGLKTDLIYQNPEDELDVAVVFRSRKSNNYVVSVLGQRIYCMLFPPSGRIANTLSRRARLGIDTVSWFFLKIADS